MAVGDPVCSQIALALWELVLPLGSSHVVSHCHKELVGRYCIALAFDKLPSGCSFGTWLMSAFFIALPQGLDLHFSIHAMWVSKIHILVVVCLKAPETCDNVWVRCS
jgi:hypothetical protein